MILTIRSKWWLQSWRGLCTAFTINKRPNCVKCSHWHRVLKSADNQNAIHHSQQQQYGNSHNKSNYGQCERVQFCVKHSCLVRCIWASKLLVKCRKWAIVCVQFALDASLLQCITQLNRNTLSTMMMMMVLSDLCALVWSVPNERIVVISELNDVETMVIKCFLSHIRNTPAFCTFFVSILVWPLVLSIQVPPPLSMCARDYKSWSFEWQTFRAHFGLAFHGAYRFSCVHYGQSFIILHTHTLAYSLYISTGFGSLSSVQSVAQNGITSIRSLSPLKTCTIIIHYGIWTLSTWNLQSGWCASGNVPYQKKMCAQNWGKHASERERKSGVCLADFLPILLAVAQYNSWSIRALSAKMNITVMQFIYSYFVVQSFARRFSFSLSLSPALFIVHIFLFIYIVMNARFMLKFASCLILLLFFSFARFEIIRTDAYTQ